MIERPTVLILGAGASHSFGFPLGSELRQRILGNLVHTGGEPVEELKRNGFQLNDICLFRDAFRHSSKLSVDAFLEHRTDCIEVGKAAIAQALIPYEDICNIFTDGINLYSYLFARLNAPLENFGNNKLSIVTYNYDRSFEHHLFTALKNSFNLNDEHAAELACSVPVVHVHGHLGVLPWQGNGGRDYVPECKRGDIRKAASTIKIIHEDISDIPEFQKAHDLIDAAERLVFLGFGYDSKNVARLKLDLKKPRPEIFGSSLGLTHNERATMNSTLFQNRLDWGFTDCDALKFVRESFYLA